MYGVYVSLLKVEPEEYIWLLGVSVTALAVFGAFLEFCDKTCLCHRCRSTHCFLPWEQLWGFVAMPRLATLLSTLMSGEGYLSCSYSKFTCFSFLHHLCSDAKRELVILVIYSAGYVVFLKLVGEQFRFLCSIPCQCTLDWKVGILWLIFQNQ